MISNLFFGSKKQLGEFIVGEESNTPPFRAVKRVLDSETKRTKGTTLPKQPYLVPSGRGWLIGFKDEQLVIADRIFKSAVKQKYKRNEYFSTVNNPSASIGFIAKGLFRVYIIDREGKEATLNFRGENMPMSSYGAVLLNQIEPVYIQALEDSVVYTVTRTELIKILETDFMLKELLQRFTELDCLALRRREFSLLQDDAKTRYLNFLDDFGLYADRIKLKFVASYLGITPEALSRIRSSP